MLTFYQKRGLEERVEELEKKVKKLKIADKYLQNKANKTKTLVSSMRQGIYSQLDEMLKVLQEKKGSRG
jgi:archaellum component FlaC